MALSTLPDDTKTPTDPDDPEAFFNRVYGGDVARGINEAEQHANSPTGDKKSVQDQEETPNSPSDGFKNNFTGKQKITGKGNFLKRKGPLGIIITLILGGGLGFTTLLSPGLLLVQMKEVMVDRFNTQLASMDVRTTKLISVKIDNTTGGICSKGITIRCKYSTMSEKQVGKFKAAGIDVEYDSKSIVGRAKPTNFKFEGKNISPADYSKTLRENPNFRGAVSNAYNPKFAGFSDSKWTSFARRVGLTKKPNITGADDATRAENLDKSTKNGITEKVKVVTAGEKVDPACTGDKCVTYTDAEAKASVEADKIASEATKATKAGSSAVGEVSEAVTEASTKGLGTLANFFKITGVVDNACQAYGAVQTLGYAAKTVRMVQLTRYAMAFLNTADMIKDGTAKPEDVAYMGGILTNIAYDAKSAANRQRGSATDSFGYKYAAYGDVGKSTNFTAQFLAGGGLTGDLINITSTIKSFIPGKAKDTCKTLANPFVQAGSLVGGFALMLVPGGGEAIQVGKLLGQGLAQAAYGVAMMVLPELLKDVVAGNVTSGIMGEDSGDAYTSGAGALGGGIANAGGNGAMTKADALAYNSIQSDTIASYTKDEVASLSPLDPSSRYTFLGSIVFSLLPSIATTQGLAGNSVSTIGSILSSSLSGLVPKTNALSTEQYKASLEVCQDEDYKALGIATDPFCNVIYGIPPQYLDKDPLVVIDELEAAGELDDLTGEAKAGSKYEAFITNCIGRVEPLGSEKTGDDGTKCIIDTTNANYYLHYVDQRIDAGMDGYETAGATATAATVPGGVGTPDNTTPKGTGWTLTDGLDYSAIACAPGAPDVGTYTHPVRKFIIRKCAFAGDEVASIVSQKVVAMFAAAKAAGVTLSLSSGFRSYEEQALLYSDNCNGSGRCNPPTAKPGNSQHEAGIALDIEYNGSTICYKNSSANCHNNAGFDWLKANAAKYGFINLPDEAWHWSTSGT